MSKKAKKKTAEALRNDENSAETYFGKKALEELDEYAQQMARAAEEETAEFYRAVGKSPDLAGLPADNEKSNLVSPTKKGQGQRRKKSND